MPGTGKTTLRKSLARSIDGTFRRIQFTPDLLPADITGSSFYSPQDGTFEFREGPVFANVVLADEINRTSPRTQSALLEVMSENQVTIEGTRRELPQPVLRRGDAEPDRLPRHLSAARSAAGPLHGAHHARLPGHQHEMEILYSQNNRHPVRTPGAGRDHDQRDLSLQEPVKTVRVERAVAEYIAAPRRSHRGDPRLRLGISPRGSLTLYRTAQARALLEGRDYVLPDDVRAMAVPVLAHRIQTGNQSKYGGCCRSR